MITIWLMLWLYIPGHEPIKLLDEQRPSIEVCMADAAAALERVSKIDGDFEYQATCAVVRDEGDPA